MNHKDKISAVTAMAIIFAVEPVAADGFFNTDQQANASGIISDTQWNLVLRSAYEQRDYLNGARSNGGRNSYLPRDQRSDFAREWGIGTVAEVKSGFSPGLIGFGVDTHLYVGQKVDASDYSVGKIRMLPVSDDGYSQNSMARGGIAAKVRIRSSVLRYGEQRVKTPVFSSSDSRLLPESMYGFSFYSEDIKGFELKAGHFNGSTDRNARSQNNNLTINYANPVIDLGDSFSYIGGKYIYSPALNLSVYTSELEDSWRTNYLGVTHSFPFSGQRSLDTSLHLYQSKDTGDSLAGDIDSITTSLFVSYLMGNHRFGLGYQKVDGDTPFDYVSRGAIWLSNAVLLSDFNAPNETSWQARYDVDMASITPGLKFGASYTRGSGTDGSGVDPDGSYAWLGYGQGGKQWERDLRLDYVVQSGSAKGLKFSLSHALLRANAAQATADTDQLKFVIEYPLSGTL